MYGSLWNCITRFNTAMESMGLSLRVIAPRGFQKVGGEGRFFVYHFLKGFLFFKIFQISNFEKFQEEIFNCTVLCNRFVRSLTTLILWQKPILCQKFDHNPNSDRIKLEYCDQICPNYSGFNHWGRIKLRPAEHLVIY